MNSTIVVAIISVTGSFILVYLNSFKDLLNRKYEIRREQLSNFYTPFYQRYCAGFFQHCQLSSMDNRVRSIFLDLMTRNLHLMEPHSQAMYSEFYSVYLDLLEAENNNPEYSLNFRRYSMNSVDRVKKICKDRKIPISKLERELGFSNGYISQLRKGVFPADRLALIADYLQISSNYLLTGEDNDGLTEKDNRDIAKDMEAIRAKLLNGTDGPLSYEREPIPEEDAELLLGQIELMMRRLKPINKEKYNPNKNKK